jgi:serine protease Do
MRFYTKHLIAIAAVLLGCIMALPVSSAQARVYSNVWQPDAGGAYLGIQMEDVNAGNLSKYRLSNERGAIVRSVVKGSPAEVAGIKEDDVILEFGGTQVWSSQQLSRLVRETPVGRNVDLVVSRDGKRMNLSAKLGTPEVRRADDMRDMFPEEPFGPGQRLYQYRGPSAGGPGPGMDPSVRNRPRLGVTVQPLTDQLAEFFGVPNKKGVLVSSVTEGSPSVGKLKSGDVIIRADAKDIETPEDLTRLVRDKSEGSVDLKVIRDKKEITVVINLPAGEEKGFKL